MGRYKKAVCSKCGCNLSVGEVTCSELPVEQMCTSCLLKAAKNMLSSLRAKKLPKNLEVIYVAGPLSTDEKGKPVSKTKQRQNVKEAILVGIELLKKGHHPFIPHLNYYLNELLDECDHAMEYLDFIAWDFSFLDRCDSLFIRAPSRGANMEEKRSKKNGMKIYHSMEEVPDVTT